MRPLSRAIGAGLSLVLLLAVSPVRGDEIGESADDKSEHAIVRRSLAKTRLSLAAGIKIAAERFPAGRLVEAYFEVDDAELLFIVELIVSNDEHKELRVDAISGKILVIKVAEQEDAGETENEAAIAKSKVALADALEKAQQRLPHSKPFDLRAEKQGDKLLIKVEVLDGADMRSVQIDPESGEVLSVEASLE